ncbi:hypothetical protein CN918_27485 [Priestia megaterium]|nr:hypothetical protein CN918_27485 [Priestia megaterium]
MVKKMVHIESLVIFLGMICLYYHFELNWWVFLIFLLAPDLAMFGYTINKKTGAIIYNLFHTYSLSLLLLGYALITQSHLFLTIGLIWTAHIAMDRIVGYGLKYVSDFKDTHLQKL